MVTEQQAAHLGPADVVIIGGCGRVGLPFGVALASRGRSVRLYDMNAAAVQTVNAGRMPFTEGGADEPLRAAVADGSLVATTDPAVVGSAEVLVVELAPRLTSISIPTWARFRPRWTGRANSTLAHGQLDQLLAQHGAPDGHRTDRADAQQARAPRSRGVLP